MNYIFLIQKTKVDPEILLRDVTTAATTLSLKVKQTHDNDKTLEIYSDENNYFEIGLDGFERSIEDKALFDGYGRLLFLFYYSAAVEKNKIIVPFLKEFLKGYPDMLVYCGSENAEGGNSIYNRSQLNASTADNISEFRTQVSKLP